MPFLLVAPGDREHVAALARILEAGRAVDDPDEPPVDADELALNLQYGWDLEPGERYLYTPDGSTEPVAALGVHAPQRDNRQLISGEVVVHPAHRRRGHGTALLAELLRQAERRGRGIVWSWSRDDDPAAAAFARANGFVRASREARRCQRLAGVDADVVDRLWSAALEKSAGYRIERLQGTPTPDSVLTELIEVTASINDAPMGELTHEPGTFDLQRLRDFETAQAGRRQRLYRVVARSRETGVVGGHTMVGVADFNRRRASQLDTAVHRDHRGHRLGVLLKIEMMRWLAEAEPQVTEVVTFNNADNDFMIAINEQLGYRLTGLFADWERKLG